MKNILIILIISIFSIALTACGAKNRPQTEKTNRTYPAK